MKNNSALAEKKSSDVIEQYLTFSVGAESYGIEISSIMEVRSWEPLQPLDEPIENFEGMISLRGKQVPIVDLRQCLNLETSSYGQHSIIIILNVLAEQVRTVIGILADAVSEVKAFSRSEFDLAQDFCQSELNWLTKIGKAGQNNMHLINANDLLQPDVLELWYRSNKQKL